MAFDPTTIQEEESGFDPTTIVTPTVDVTGEEFGGTYLAKDSWENRFKNVLASDIALVGGVKGLVTPGEGFFDYYGRSREQALGTLGGQEIPVPEDFMGQSAEMMKQAAIDPLSYVGAPLKAGSLVKMGLGNVLTTPGMVGGGMVGNKAEQVYTGQDETSGLGTLLGSLGTVPFSVGAQGTVSNIVDASTNTTKSLWKGWTNKDEAVKAYSDSAVKGFLENTREAGNYDLEKTIEDFSKIHKNIVGDDAPLLTALSANPEVKATLNSLVNRPGGAVFKAKVDDEIKRVRDAINAKATEEFGPSVLNIIPTDAIMAKATLKNLADVQARVKTFDNKIADFSAKYDTGMSQEDVGSAISNLIKAKEKLIKEEEIAPLYNSVKKDADTAKVVMPAGGTKMIYDFVKANNLSDLFTRGSRIESDINKFFKPTKEGYPDVTFSNVVSLKENINQLKREFNPGTNEYRRINELSKKVEEARMLIPGDYNERLKNADKMYYQRLGVPFNEQGILDIDSRKYAEQVAPVITKTPSALDDFLQVTGEEGTAIAKNAILSDLYNSSKGDLSVKNIASYLFKKKDIISKIPELENDLKIGLVDAEALAGTRKELNDKANVMQKEIADNFMLANKTLGPNYSQIANDMLTDRGKLVKIKKDISQLEPKYRDAVDGTVKRAVLDKVLSHENGAMDYLSQPDNKKTIEFIFGKEYVEGVENFAKLSDSLARMDTSKIPITADKGSMDILGRVIPGLDAPYVTSTLRDRISSTTQKAVRLASRISNDMVAKKTTAALEDILLDKDALVHFNKNIKKLDLKSPLDLQKAIEAYSILLPSRTIQSVRVGSQKPTETPISEEVQPGEFQ